MRILLLSCARSGSTSLLKSLSKNLNLYPITLPESFEYLRDEKLISHILEKNNIIVRSSTLTNHRMSIIEFINKFDHTILLSRKNNEDHKISFANLYHKKMYNETVAHDTYTVSEIPEYIFELQNFKTNFNSVIEDKKCIENISKELKIPVLYYENIYESEESLYILKNHIPNIDFIKLKKYLGYTNKMRKPVYKSII